MLHDQIIKRNWMKNILSLQAEASDHDTQCSAVFVRKLVSIRTMPFHLCVEFHVKFYDSKDVCVTISSYSKYLHMNSAPFVHAMEVTRNCLASNVFSSDSLLHLMDLQDTQVDSWGLVRIFMAHYPAFINTEGLLWVRNLFWKCAYNSRRIFLFPRSIVPGFLNELWAFVCLRFVWIMLSNIYYVN